MTPRLRNAGSATAFDVTARIVPATPGLVATLKGKPVSVIATSTDEPDEQGLHR